MNGIINLFKSGGITSFGAVAAVRRLTGEKKCGHGGTLDPEAKGILPVLVGKATRLSGRFLSFQKTYLAELTLGLESDTCDIWGRVSDVSADPRIAERMNSITEEDFAEALCGFRGTVLQKPPAYSAIKIGGQPSYKLARRGGQPEPEEREVIIYSTEPLEFHCPTAVFRVTCGRGTYIRSLCVDVGAKLGVPAVMSGLTRERYGHFDIGGSFTIEDIERVLEGADEAEKERVLKEAGILLSPECVLTDLPAVRLGTGETFKYKNGLAFAPSDVPQMIRDNGADAENGDASIEVKVYGADGGLLGVGSIRDGRLRPSINLGI